MQIKKNDGYKYRKTMVYEEKNIKQEIIIRRRL